MADKNTSVEKPSLFSVHISLKDNNFKREHDLLKNMNINCKSTVPKKIRGKSSKQYHVVRRSPSLKVVPLCTQNAHIRKVMFLEKCHQAEDTCNITTKKQI